MTDQPEQLAIDRVVGLVSMGVGITEQEFYDALAEAWDEGYIAADRGWQVAEYNAIKWTTAPRGNPYRNRPAATAHECTYDTPGAGPCETCLAEGEDRS